MTDHICEFCEVLLVRRPREHRRDFDRRRFCDWACKSDQSAQVLAAEIECLTGTDEPDAIAHRLGYKNAGSLARVLHRYGYNDLARPFARHHWHTRCHSKAKVRA